MGQSQFVINRIQFGLLGSIVNDMAFNNIKEIKLKIF